MELARGEYEEMDDSVIDLRENYTYGVHISVKDEAKLDVIFILDKNSRNKIDIVNNNISLTFTVNIKMLKKTTDNILSLGSRRWISEFLCLYWPKFTSLIIQSSPFKHFSAQF